MATVLLLLGGLCPARAFVLMGPLNPDEALPPSGLNFNYNDDFGGPKDIRRFFRWNMPALTYSFDASFVNYFGLEGLGAVHEAFGVVNDFFHNEDYSGMSQLDFEKHGFAGNFATHWENTTAKNAQVIDLKSLVLGMLLNQLGMGNPHRHAFTIVGATSNAVNSQVVFSTSLRNYDPVTLDQTDRINGVGYSYRLVHDATNGPTTGGSLSSLSTADMEEFTTDSSAAAWSAVAGIADAFYGNTAFYWTDTPTRYNFGVYYDGANAMGGQRKPRHALTYDDAGGLRYLYRTNTYAYEDLDLSVTLIEPAQFLAEADARHFPTPSGRLLPSFPRGSTRAGSLLFEFPLTGRLRGMPINGPSRATAQNVVLVAHGLRGGIDRMQFHHRPFDSLLGRLFIETNFVWTDTFVSTNANNVGGLNLTKPGSSAFLLPPNSQFFTQKIGRTVNIPDILMLADDLGPSPAGVPIAFDRTTTNGWSNNAALQPGYASLSSLTNKVGPGNIFLPPTSIIWGFTRFTENFEVIWSGEVSVVGNLEEQPSLWGRIKGPGPNDVVIFPRGGVKWEIENQIVPNTTPPSITMVSDDGGVNPIAAQTLTRTEETLTLIGNELASVTAIEIMDGNLVLQTIMPAHQYVVSNQRIDIPAGLISDAAEGNVRTVRAWNTIGASEVGPQEFKIEAGKPVITASDFDNQVFDRAQTLVIQGYGFKSKAAGETRLAYIRVDDAGGSAVDDNGTGFSLPSNGLPRAAAFEVVSDTLAELSINAIGGAADGSNRRLRVARKTVANAADVDNVLSPASNAMFSAITSKPIIGTVWQMREDNSWEDALVEGMFKRDRAVEINGTALNTATVIEVVQENGSSFTDPVFIQLPNAGVSVEDNGTRILMSANSIPYSDADTNSTAKRAFKVYNAVGSSDLNASQVFAVNTQPLFDAVGAFASAGHFNRDKVVGDDINIFGSGLKAVSQIIFTDANDTSQNRLIVDLPAPGVTVADNQITIDTQTYQVDGAADTNVNSSRRVIRLTSARDDAVLSVAQGFYVGGLPSITTLGGVGAEGNYTRDTETLTVTGTGFGHVTQFEIVDANGNPIAGVVGLVSGGGGAAGTGLNIHGATSLSVDSNASGWVNVAHLLDTVTDRNRRVKVTTPFGVATSNSTAGTGAFTVSAAPEFMNSVQATFAGGGFTADDPADADDVNGTYDRSEGDLHINGKNLRGVRTIAFYSGAGVNDGNFTIDPNNPPAGISVNVEGTLIIVDDDVIPAGWVDAEDSNGTVGLVSVAGAEVNSTTPIQVQP